MSVNPIGGRTTFTYDSAGRLLSAYYPAGSRTTIVFDSAKSSGLSLPNLPFLAIDAAYTVVELSDRDGRLLATCRLSANSQPIAPAHRDLLSDWTALPSCDGRPHDVTWMKELKTWPSTVVARFFDANRNLLDIQTIQL